MLRLTKIADIMDGLWVGRASPAAREDHLYLQDEALMMDLGPLNLKCCGTALEQILTGFDMYDGGFDGARAEFLPDVVRAYLDYYEGA